jgi:hypothetical protein
MTGTLTAADFKASGSITTFADAVAAIAAGGTYVNVHTAANPGGEIRGQLAVTVAQPPAATANPTLPPTSTLPQPAAPASGIPWAALVLVLGVTIAVIALPGRYAGRSIRR